MAYRASAMARPRSASDAFFAGRRRRTVQRAKGRDELSDKNREVTRSRGRLLHGDRTTRQSCVSPDGVLRREDRTTRELVPDGEGEAEIDVLSPHEPVMDSVIVRADEHATERAESQIGVRMLEGDDAGVDDEERRGYGAVGQ